MLPDPGSSGILAQVQGILATLNWLDWVLLLLALWSMVRGFLRGAIVELFALAASVLALLAAYWWYRPAAATLARWWTASAPERELISFLLIAGVIFSAVLVLGRLVRRFARLVGLGLLDRLAGAALGLARAVVLCTLLLSAITAFLPGAPAATRWIAQSHLAPLVVNAASLLAAFAPAEVKVRIVAGMELLTRLRPASR